MIKWALSLIPIILFNFSLSALDENFEETRSPEVMYMFPDSKIIPAVELALPKNFIGSKSRNTEDDRVYWGSMNALTSFFLSHTVKKNQPIISVKISTNTKQKELSEENIKYFIDMILPKINLKHVKVQFLKWGSYPVVAMENKHQNETIMYAWVGLNAPDGETLLINYLFPNGKKHPTKEERALWNKFLTETKELPLQFKWIVDGHDLHPGYTVVKLGETKFRIIAEKRKSDDKQLVVFQPLNDKTDFEYVEMSNGELESEWNKGAKVVKVKGKVKVDKKAFDETTTVMLKEVDDFSVTPEELKKNSKLVVLDAEQKNSTNSKRSRRARN